MRSQVVGYEVFYSMSDVDDLDIWQRKTVGLVTSIDLVNLERHAQVCVIFVLREEGDNWLVITLVLKVL